MKKLILLTAIVFGLLASTLNARTIYNKNINVNYFFGALEPYGEWIEIDYDEYVWRPYDTDRNWRPYSEGRWEWTRNGWYWVSYEPYGWATYHYGRWFYDDYYGWLWMPDNIWAPSWVEWRYNDNYIGWAPLPPYARFNPRSGIYFSVTWSSHYYHWNFVKYRHFANHNVHVHFVNRYNVNKVFKKTKYRTNYFTDNNRIVNGGISRRLVEKRIGKKFTTRTISRTDRFSDYNSRNIKNRKDIVDFRPSVKDANKRSSFNKAKVTKGRSLKTLKSDKVIINKRNPANKSTKKNNVKKNRAELKKDVRKSTEYNRENKKAIKSETNTRYKVGNKSKVSNNRTGNIKKNNENVKSSKPNNYITKSNERNTSSVRKKLDKDKTKNSVTRSNKVISKKNGNSINKKSTKTLTKKTISKSSRKTNKDRF